jgi:acetyl esterase/lipase
VAGGSAGAGLAAAVALRARDEGAPRLRGQVLIYPFLDASLGTRSIRTLADAPVFNAEDARHCWDHYLGDQRSSPPPYGSPAAAPDLAGLPPAYVVAAGADCLRDEAVDYALRLQAAGVPTELHVIPDVPHGFSALLPTASVSRRARREFTEVLARMLADKEEIS